MTDHSLASLCGDIAKVFGFSCSDAADIIEDMLKYNIDWYGIDSLRHECFKYAQRLVNAKINEVKK